MPPVRLGLFKWLMRFATMAAAFFSIYYFVANQPPTAFAGKWKVTELQRNGKTAGRNDWLTNPDSWCNVYIEEGGQLALSPNPYIYDEARAMQAGYRYDASKHTLKLILGENDTLYMTVSQYNGKTMQWNGNIHNNILQLKLTKTGN